MGLSLEPSLGPPCKSKEGGRENLELFPGCNIFETSSSYWPATYLALQQSQRVREPVKKTAIFGQKTLILALFCPFFKGNFRPFSVKGGGGVGYPLNVKNPLKLTLENR